MASRHSPSLESWFAAAVGRDYASVTEWADAMARSVDRNRETALMKAVRAQDSQMVHILAEHEAGETNDKGYTALIIAAINNLGSLCAILAPFESDITLFGGRTALMMAASVSARSSIDALIPAQHGRRDDNGMTALMYAVTYGNVDAASALVGCEKRILSSENKSALVIAAEHYRKDMIRLLYPHEHGLLPAAEKVVLAPYRSTNNDSQYVFSSSESANCSDTEPEPHSQRRSKSISFYRPSRSVSLNSAAHIASKTSSDPSLDHRGHRSSLDLSWSDSHAPHKVRLVRIKLSPQRSGRQSHFDSAPRQQRTRSAGSLEHTTNAAALARRQLNAPQPESYKLLQENSSKNASPRLRTKTFAKVDQQIVARQPFSARQKPVRSRQPTEALSEQCVPGKSSRYVPYNAMHCQPISDGPPTESRKRTAFTPTPTPEPNRAENNLLLALRHHIVALEHELQKKECELQALTGLTEDPHKLVLAPQEHSKRPTYQITFTQCATQTEAVEEYKVPQSTRDPTLPHTTHLDTMKRLQEDAYLKQLCTSLSLIKEDILLLCNTAQQEYTSQEHLVTELPKDHGSLDHKLEDDTFIVLTPCNHLVDLACFTAEHQGGEEDVSITKCPRCGARPVSIITVKM